MQKSNVNGALRLLTNYMSNGILPLSEETLQMLSLKHRDNKLTTKRCYKAQKDKYTVLFMKTSMKI